MLNAAEHEFVSWPHNPDAELSTVKEMWIVGEIGGKLVAMVTENFAGEELGKWEKPWCQGNHNETNKLPRLTRV